jgi:hypothetical protein
VIPGSVFGLDILTPYGKFFLHLERRSSVEDMRNTIRQKTFWLQHRNEGANSMMAANNTLQIWTKMGTQLFFLDPEDESTAPVEEHFQKKEILWVKVGGW